jgi:putative O-methyltransferase
MKIANKKPINEPVQVSKTETEILLKLLDETLEFEGDIVEFGCYKGDTSVLFESHLEQYLKNNKSLQNLSNPTELSLGLNSKQLYLYDSFEGLPVKTEEDSSAAGDQFKAGELFVTKREVIEKFKRSWLKVRRLKKLFLRIWRRKMSRLKLATLFSMVTSMKVLKLA